MIGPLSPEGLAVNGRVSGLGLPGQVAQPESRIKVGMATRANRIRVMTILCGRSRGTTL